MSGNKKSLLNRYTVILILILLFALAIVIKLFSTTYYYAKGWNEFAESQMRDSVVIYPQRGNILASDGSLLAANVRIYDIGIDFGAEPFKADTLRKYMKPLCDSLRKIDKRINPEKMCDAMNARLEKSLKISEYNKKAKKEGRELKRNPYRRFILLRKCSNEDKRRVLALKFFRTSGGKNTLFSDATDARIKPYGAMAAQSIGAVAEERVNKRTVVMHGTTGLEKALDSLLFGTPGMGRSIQLTSGIRNWAEIEPQRGYDILTTIDIRIQDILETELHKRCEETNAEWGTAVIMEVATGEIKAISNLQRNKKTGKLQQGVNFAFRGFEPGSVIKPISMLIALEDNIVGINDYIPTGKSFAYGGGRAISDSHAYAGLAVKDIVPASSNIGMAKVILRGFERNPEKFRQRLKEIGMFDKLKLGIYGESTPYIPVLTDSNRVDLTRVSYGYATRIPPIYTLAFYNAIANGGKFIRPRLVKELWKDGLCDTVFPISYVRERICRPEVAAQLREMLKAVVWDKKGTAKALRNNFVSISGKTGTAYDIVDGHYDSSKKRLAFCGFFPSDAPKYSCIVLMSHANVGAALSSGTVLMNTALRMYARGMLGNVSDYRTESDNRNTPITFTAVEKSTATSLKSELGISGVRKLRRHNTRNGVPSVIGMGVRDALATLEEAGLNVSGLYGSGYVCAQSLAPGSKYYKGEKITLQLKE